MHFAFQLSATDTQGYEENWVSEWVSEWVSYLLYFYKVITRRLVSYREMLYLIKYRFNFLFTKQQDRIVETW